MWGKPGVAMADQRTEIPRDEGDIPTRWYSAVPNPPQPVTPDLHTGTWQPIGPDDLDLALVPPPVDADEPGYHGGVPVHCKLNNDLSLPPLAEPHSRVLKTAVPVGRTEGIISAPESARATLSVINRAFVARVAGEWRVIQFSLSGRGPLRHGRLRRLLRWSLPRRRLPRRDD